MTRAKLQKDLFYVRMLEMQSTFYFGANWNIPTIQTQMGEDSVTAAQSISIYSNADILQSDDVVPYWTSSSCVVKVSNSLGTYNNWTINTASLLYEFTDQLSVISNFSIPSSMTLSLPFVRGANETFYLSKTWSFLIQNGYGVLYNAGIDLINGMSTANINAMKKAISLQYYEFGFLLGLAVLLSASIVLPGYFRLKKEEDYVINLFNQVPGIICYFNDYTNFRDDPKNYL